MLYQWDSPQSLIHRVRFLRPHRAEEALIFAPPGADSTRLQHLALGLEAAGMSALADTIGGEHALRVGRFSSRAQLLGALEGLRAVAGPGIQQEEPGDKKPKQSFAERVKDNSMTYSGYLYSLGDALLLAAGLTRGKEGRSEAAIGVVWLLSGLVLAGFGKKDPDRQTAHLYRELVDYLHKEGVEIPKPDEITAEKLASKGGFYDKIKEFLYNHPVEFNNSIQAAGGLMMIKAGMDQRSPWDDKRNWFKTAAGVSVSNGQFWGMVIPQKDNPHRAASPALAEGQRLTQAQEARAANDHEGTEKDERSLWRRAVDWVQEKPLRLTGIGAFTNNVLNVGGAVVELRKINKFLDPKSTHPQAYATLAGHYVAREMENELVEMKAKANSNAPAVKADFSKTFNKERDEFFWRHEEAMPRGRAIGQKLKRAENFRRGAALNLGTAGCYMLANALYGMSSKEREGDIAALGMLDEVYALAAHVGNAQPPEYRDAVVARIAGFLACQPSVKKTSREIEQTIRHKMQGLETSPWIVRLAASPAANDYPGMGATVA